MTLPLFLSALCGNKGTTGETLHTVYGSQRLEYLRRCTSLFPHLVSSSNLEVLLPNLQDIRVIFSTWSMVPLEEAQMDRIPSLTDLFYAAMPDNATFINTGRGRTVNYADLLEFFQQRPGLTALSDVTHPGPLPREHPLHLLSNVHITSHIAGSIGYQQDRVADYTLEEFQDWQNGRPSIID